MSTLATGLRDRAAQASADAVAAYQAAVVEQALQDRDRDARKMRTAAAQQLGEHIMAGGVEYDDDNLRLLLPDGITLQYSPEIWSGYGLTRGDFVLCAVCPKCEEWYSGTKPIGGRNLSEDQKLASLGAALEQDLPPHNCDEEIDEPAAPPPAATPTLREQATLALDDAESALDGDDPERAIALATIAVAKALGEIHDVLAWAGGQR